MALSKIPNNMQAPLALATSDMPAGTILQFKQSVNQSMTSQTWNGVTTGSVPYGANRGGRTYTEARSIAITPTSTNSILYCVGNVGWTSMAATSTMGHGQIITRNDGNDCIDNSDYPWYSHSYITGSNLYYPSETVVGTFSPASISAQTIRLRPYLYIETGAGTGAYNCSSLFVMEIAQ